MKFKVGDKVKHKVYGVGEIIGFDVNDKYCPYAVKFEKPNDSLNRLGGYGAPLVENKHGYWCSEEELGLVKEEPKNLISEIAKMLGVEIGEGFEISNKPDVYKFTEDGLICLKGNKIYNPFSILYELISGKEKIIKLPKKPILTEDEKVILRNLPKEYKWVARDSDNNLYIYAYKPTKNEFMFNVQRGFSPALFFNHLFQFIKWEDEQPYNIEELLKEVDNEIRR